MLSAALTVLALSGAHAPLASCSWDRPGAHPFMGDVPAAVDHYADIPQPVRQRLKARMAVRDSDDFVAITRDAIAGRHGYGPDISGMHFGSAGRVCAEVSRAHWKPGALERGLVYCESGYCIVVPTVCRNVARITRRPDEEPLDINPSAGPLMAPADGEPPLAALGEPGASPLGSDAPPAGFGPVPGDGGLLPAGPADGDGHPALPPLLPPVIGGGGGGGLAPPPPARPVPEPAAWLELAAGAALLWAAWRRRATRRP